MAEELFIPQLGQTVEEVTIVEWTAQDGAKVEFGQPVMDVETDKAVFPVEANANGYLHIGPYKVGDTVPVLTVVATIGKQDEPFAAQGAPAPAEAAAPAEPPQPAKVQPAGFGQGSGAPAGEMTDQFISPRARKLAREKGVDTRLVTPTGGGGARVREHDVLDYLRQQPKVTPVARRMAEAEGVDLKQVAGAGGRITKEDVAGALRSTSAAAAPTAPQPIPTGEVTRIPLKGVRGIIAERMAASVHTSARVTLLMEVDATALVQLRKQLKARFEPAWGFTPTYNDLLVKVCAAALKAHPNLNARLTEDAIELVPQINIGVAVDTDRGLLVPVIPGADRLSLREVSAAARTLVERARAGRSLPDDLAGGTFTITNLGMYDIDGFTPVINLPEAAILGVGRIAPRPVYVGEDLVRRETMVLSLVFDHRLVDGAPAARFLQTVKTLIEDPSLILAYL